MSGSMVITQEVVEPKKGMAKILIGNIRTDSEIDYFDGLTEIYDTDVKTGEKVKFLVPKMSQVILKKEVKEKVLDAIADALAEQFIEPYTVLIPKSWVTRRKLPVGEMPIPFNHHTLHLVPHIREIMVYEQWQD